MRAGSSIIFSHNVALYLDFKLQLFSRLDLGDTYLYAAMSSFAILWRNCLDIISQYNIAILAYPEEVHHYKGDD